MQVNQLTDIVSNLKQAKFKYAKLLAQVILIMLSIGNVTVYKLATCLPGNTQLSSKEKSIRRMLSQLFNPDTYARFIHYLFQFDKVELVMDRTNWKIGKTYVNLFILSFIWHGMAIPLYWVRLDKKSGSTSSQERIDMLEWFINKFGADKIINLYADREFPSKEFIEYLTSSSVNFIFRIKDTILGTDRRNGKISKCKLRFIFNILVYGHPHAVQTIRTILGCKVYATAKRTINDELVILISNQIHTDPFELYGRRWHIEVMFNKQKTKGFNLENTHIKHETRLLSLFTIIAICYSYSCLLGKIREELKPVKYKRINKIPTKMFGTFRYGLDLIQHILFNRSNKLFMALIECFSQGAKRKLHKSLSDLMLNF